MDINFVPNHNEKTEKNWFQILAIFAGSLCSLTMGALLAWPSPSIPKIIQDKVNYDITLAEASYFTVLPPIGILTSCLLFSKLNDWIGRKYTLLLITVPHLSSWILISTANTVYVFYLARFIAGVGDACMFASLPIYIGEVATPNVRGTWGNFMTCFIYLGQFLINLVGSFNSVKVTAVIALSVPITFFCIFVFMPETPYFYVMKNKYEDARKSLQRLRRKQNVDEELEKIKSDVSRQMSEAGTWRDVFCNKTNRRAVIAGVFLRATQLLSGFGALISYTQYIFLKSGSKLSATTSSLIFMGLCALLNFFAILVVDKLGRRIAYFISSLFCGVFLAGEALYFFIDVDSENFAWFPVCGMIFYMIFFAFGLGIVPTLMAGELFSASIKGKASMLLNIVFAITISVTTKLFHILDTEVGLFCPFLCFAVFCFLTSVGTIFIVPETKGKTLEEIQQLLKKD